MRKGINIGGWKRKRRKNQTTKNYNKNTNNYKKKIYNYNKNNYNNNNKLDNISRRRKKLLIKNILVQEKYFGVKK